jgi:hypothetical protein
MVGGWFEIEDRFLDVRGKLGEVDDLRYASSGNAGGSGAPCAKTLLRRTQDLNGSVCRFKSVRSIDFLEA